MTTASYAPRLAPPIWLSASGLGDRAIALLVFFGAFVLFEPAPYELLLIGILGIWALAGALTVSRYILPLVLLLLAYVIGCALSLTQVPDLSKPLMYFAVSALLAASSIFYAMVIPAAPERRLPLIAKAYVAGAIFAASVGIVGYFGVGGDLFTLYGRARGPFQDPNVFGPFLVLPLCYLVHAIFTGRPRDALFPLAGAGLIMIAIFLTFSRAAWAMSALAIGLTTLFAFINQRGGTGRVRIIGFVVMGGILLAVMLGVLLSLPGTGELFSERAQLVQYYDGGEGGRFDRWIEGFLLMLERPLGIGPYEFGLTYFSEDEHNTWLKGFTTYGWLGGLSYIALVITTLSISVPLLFKPRVWRPVVIAAFATYVGQVTIHFVIDNDHWRHLYLIYGILWGAYAAEKLTARRERLAGPAAIPPPVPTYRVALERGPAAG